MPRTFENEATPSVSVIIVSFNTLELTLRCLDTLKENSGCVDCEVILVDNASVDGSVDAVRHRHPDVKIIENASNVGFGAANNIGIRSSRGELLVLLNSDAFISPGAIEAMRDFLARNPDYGVVGPRIVNADGSLQLSCFRFPSPLQMWLENLWVPRLFPEHPLLGDLRGWKHDEERAVDFVIGACLMVRRQVVESVGGFDERFFMYAEETDWLLRISKAGWKIGFTPAGQVVHIGGASGKMEPESVNPAFFESLDRYQLKHYGAWGFIAVRAAMVVGCSLRSIAWFLAGLLPNRAELARRKRKKHLALVRRQMFAPAPSL